MTAAQNWPAQKVVSTPLALDMRTEFSVVRHSERKKRRKNWRVRRVEVSRPGCLLIDGVVYMHPDLISMIPKKAPDAS